MTVAASCQLLPVDTSCMYAYAAPMPGRIDRRERNRIRTREALADAAARLFSEHGFAATTVEDIADEAGVSPRTFFRYFECKEDALVPDVAGITALVVEALAPSGPEEPLHVAIRRAVLAMVRELTTPERLARTRLALSIPGVLGRMLETQARLEQVFAKRIATRLQLDIDADPLPRVAAGAAMACVRAGVHAPDRPAGRTDPIAAASRAVDLLDAGLASFPSPCHHAASSRADDRVRR